jgi:zinc protease
MISMPLDRRVPPSPGPVRPFRFPPFARRRLACGLTLLTARLPEVPLVNFELVVPAGGQYDLPGKSGLATLTGSTIDEGTATSTSMEIAARVEHLGGYFATGADWDVGYLSTGLLARHAGAGLQLLADVLGAPTFPEWELERLRRQRLTEIQRRAYDPSALADERMAEALYAGTVYAQPLLGVEESIASLTRDELVAFYRRHYTLAGSALVEVGDLDPEVMAAEVETIFSGIAGGEVAPIPTIQPPHASRQTVVVVDRPEAAQTELRLGHVGIDRRDPDYLPLLVMNTLLGGKFTSRINLNLRERHGVTYGASSRFVTRQGKGPFLVGAAVATESTGLAVREVLAELRRIREELVDPVELDETRTYLTGVFPYTAQTIADVAKRLETLAVFGLPDDYFDAHLVRLAAVTREEVREVAERHLDPEHIAVVAVGPSETLAAQLAEYGPVDVRSSALSVPAAPVAPVTA